MKFVIKHEIRGRIRVHLIGKAMSFAQADTLQYQFEQMKDVTAVKVQERTMDVTICYIGSRAGGVSQKFRTGNESFLLG